MRGLNQVLPGAGRHGWRTQGTNGYRHDRWSNKDSDFSRKGPGLLPGKEILGGPGRTKRRTNRGTRSQFHMTESIRLWMSHKATVRQKKFRTTLSYQFDLIWHISYWPRCCIEIHPNTRDMLSYKSKIWQFMQSQDFAKCEFVMEHQFNCFVLL